MNFHTPHPDSTPVQVQCAVITVSDTRSPETDTSGQLIQDLLRASHHPIQDYFILKDEPTEIQASIQLLASRQDIQAIILNGGTGIAPRDTTFDAIERLLEKTLPGFGEIFRALSYDEVGSRAITSRAVAGVYQRTLIFSLPGSKGAVKLGMEKLILPELIHLVGLL